MFKKRLIVFTLFLSAVAIYLTLTPTAPLPTKEDSQLNQDDWQVFNSESWHINKQNTQQQTFLKTPFMHQRQQRVFINQPNMILAQPSQTLHLSALKAEISTQDIYQFRGDVIVNRYHQDRAHKLQLKTERLDYNQTLNQLSSDQAIRLISEHQTTSGIGLKINIEQHHLSILSKVKTYYEP